MNDLDPMPCHRCSLMMSRFAERHPGGDRGWMCPCGAKLVDPEPTANPVIPADRFDSVEMDHAQRSDVEELKMRLRGMEDTILWSTNPGRERSRALTALEDFAMLATRAIARRNLP